MFETFWNKLWLLLCKSNPRDLCGHYFLVTPILESYMTMIVAESNQQMFKEYDNLHSYEVLM